MNPRTPNLIAAAALSLFLALPFGGEAAVAATLPAQASAALERALADERQAEAFYASVISKFGEVRPFVNIIKAERRHASTIEGLMATYGVVIPPVDPVKLVVPPVPATLAEACAIGTQAEIANKDLYDKELIPAAQGYQDIIDAFTALRDASQDNHLPAFRRCGG